MIYTTTDYYTAEILQQCYHAVFVFGDNQQRLGHGGQAIIRNEPNAFGIVTKRSCREDMTGTLADFEAVIRDIRNLEAIMPTRAVVFPITTSGNINIGTGLANLPPQLYDMINEWFHNLGPKNPVKLT